MMKKIHYTKPSISDLEIKYANDAVKNGWGEKCYDYIIRFEESFKKYLDVKFAIATSSCTGALHMGLAALGIGNGDEVILADTNWIATASPIKYLSATPVFVDIRKDTWCIDPIQAEAAITKKTKAIIATHLYGNLCDMDRLLAIGKEYNIPIIEDSAEAIGSVYHGKKAGSMGSFGTFSFHGTKSLTTGEGGMFVTNDEKLYNHVLTLSNHGRAKDQVKQFWPDMIGFKYKMSNVQAAIGCGQIERVDELVGRKRDILNYYKQRLKSFSGIHLNPEYSGTINGAWMPTVVFDKAFGVGREQLINKFKSKHIDARVFFWPLSSLPFFETANNPNAYSIAERAINLPSYHDMSEKDLQRVTDELINVLK